jgi:DNA-binding NarL/FixJ family response regulator
LRQIIAPAGDLSVCGEVDSAASALEAVGTLSIDLAIVDLSMGISDLSLARRLLAVDATLLLLMLSTHDDVRFAERALQAGARGFLLKQQAPELLIGAIREILAGRLYVSPQMMQEILQRIASSGDWPRIP